MISRGRFDVTVDSYHLCRLHLYLDYNFEEETLRCSLSNNLWGPLLSLTRPSYARGRAGVCPPEQVCTPAQVTSSAPGSREFVSPRSVISSLALLTSGFSLLSLSTSSFWSKQADLWVTKSSLPPPLRTLEEEVVSSPRSQEWLRPWPSRLASLCPFPWKWDCLGGWFAVRGRWLLLRSIWFWLLEGSD